MQAKTPATRITGPSPDFTDVLEHRGQVGQARLQGLKRGFDRLRVGNAQIDIE